MSEDISAIRTDLKPKTVFVIGAGFSAELDYPLTRDLLPNIVDRLGRKLREQFFKVIRFHHPTCDMRPAMLPEIEELLTEWTANEDLLPSLRQKGPYTIHRSQRIRRDLLYEIARWFYAKHEKQGQYKKQFLSRFLDRIHAANNPVLISFNWDCEIDSTLFREVMQSSYGINEGSMRTPVLLKPHGSLNWYPANTGKFIEQDRRFILWKERDHEKMFYCFKRWRLPHSTRRRYLPWIVPPTHFKDVNQPMSRFIWKRCVDALSLAERVYFLGYSLPPADWHSRYVFRCGFHNQKEGFPLPDGGRADPTGKARVFVINPENTAFRRIESVVGWKCKWIPQTIGKWLMDPD